MKIEIIKKSSVITTPKPEKSGYDSNKQTNTRFIWSFDGKPCHDAPTSKPEKNNG